MAQGVKAGVFPLAVNGDACRDLRGYESTVDNVGQRLNVASTVREHEIEISLRAGKLPLLQRVGREFANGDNALASGRLWPADIVEPISSLPDVNFIGSQIDICPAKAAQF